MDEQGSKFYFEQMQEVANRLRTSMEIYLDDLETFHKDPEFVAMIIRNTQRYVDVFACAIDVCMPPPTITEIAHATVEDVYTFQRLARLQQLRDSAPEGTVIPSLPAQLLRRYEVRILPRRADGTLRLREIKAHHVGSLVSLRGVITRVTDVKPMMQMQTYMCTECRHEAYQTIEGREFTPLRDCPSAVCRQNNAPGKLFLQVRGSKMRTFQEIKLQELPTEVPVGNVPRSMTLRVYGDLVRTAKPGDVITCSGIFLPLPYQGYRAIKAGLVTETYLECSAIDVAKKSYNDLLLTEDEANQLDTLAQDPAIYEKLAASISPEIHGHVDTKKALLLSMVGGVTKTMRDGMRIRGDINVLLVGDPGMAKSQLLKHITKLAPRAVYTTGKGSSGVGLTAAVVKDTLTGDLTLEGGALVLADQGICCIDEFDKMDENDRTAIHEVMEQQTVSIAKAGITTSLNARTTVLAAANPAYGRYNKRRSINENLDMPAALLSRFDLVFIMLDKATQEGDEQLARHITYVHRHASHPPLAFTPMSGATIRSYIARAKVCEPVVSPDLMNLLADNFVSMREETKKAGMAAETSSYDGSNSRESFCTARSLLSILRLSQAVARVHFRDVVLEADVYEAVRLITQSKQALEEDPQRGPQDQIAAIYTAIMALRRARGENSLSMNDVRAHLTVKGFLPQQIERCLEIYNEQSVWHISRDRNKLTFV